MKLRFFAGLTMPEAAAALGISLATAKRYWTFARSWLHGHGTDGSSSTDLLKETEVCVRGWRAVVALLIGDFAKGPAHGACKARRHAIFSEAIAQAPRSDRYAMDGACAVTWRPAGESRARCSRPRPRRAIPSMPHTASRSYWRWPLTERPGTVIGPYKLLEQIGEGGMGVVYMAEQERAASARR